MTVSDYTYLLNRPDAVNDRQTQELEKIVNEFPYFQSARALRLKGLYNQNSFQYNYALKVTAAHTTDRSVLFDFITSDTFTAIHKGLYERKLAELYNIDVSGSEIVQPVTHADPTIDKIEQSILTSIRESEIPYDKEVFYDEIVPEEQKPLLYAVIDDAESEVESEYNIETKDIAADDEADQDEITSKKIVVGDSDNSALSDQSVVVESESADIDSEEQEPSSDIETNTTSIPAETDNTYSQIEEVASAEAEVNKMVPKEVADDRLPETVSNIDNSEDELQTSVEEKLQLGLPLEFASDEKHSFQEWLQLSRVKPIEREENVIEENNSDITVSDASAEIRELKNQLIDRFIETSPKIPPVKQDARPMAIPEAPIDNASLMTETLARVYLEQKKYTKAIQAYEILILKYPEKSSFFADRISEIRNLQQNNLIQ